MLRCVSGRFGRLIVCGLKTVADKPMITLLSRCADAQVQFERQYMHLILKQQQLTNKQIVQLPLQLL